MPHARELAIENREKCVNKSTLAKEIHFGWRQEKPHAPTTRTLEDFVDELIQEDELPPFDTKRSRFASEIEAASAW